MRTVSSPTLLVALVGLASAMPMPQATPTTSSGGASTAKLTAQGEGVPVTTILGQAEAFTAASRVAASINQTAAFAERTTSYSTALAAQTTSDGTGSAVVTQGTSVYPFPACPTDMVAIFDGITNYPEACCPGIYYNGECHRTDTGPLPTYPPDTAFASIARERNAPNALPNAAGRSVSPGPHGLLAGTAIGLALVVGALLL